MSDFKFDEHPHRRFNPLTREWVLVSPHRAKRPWQGQEEKIADANRPANDPKCYLCPGNKRSNSEVNPAYEDSFVFTNDFSALLEQVPSGKYSKGEFFKAKSEQGICKVICFSPRHNLTIPEMATVDVRKIVDVWCNEYEALGKKDFINYIQIFENKGAVMGCSNPHPHGQIWAQNHIPVEPAKKQYNQLNYWINNKSSLLLDYVTEELENQERILFSDQHFVVLVPFCAVWPFEAMIVPRRHVSRITDLTDSEKTAFAEAYRQLAILYDNLFQVSFPYSAGIHQAPTDGQKHEKWHLHMVFYQPLLRSATVKKFMVGYEMLANPQRDITPEQSAARLRQLRKVHFKSK
ncbi:MAG TPA: UDP-glucose--hexose-1-phosphate uridylyltransferase [Bacteroidales bacterium]